MNMLRSTRGLLLLAIIVMLGAVASIYYRQKQSAAAHAPRTPKSLPVDTDASAVSWTYRKDQDTHGIVEVRARRMKQLNSPSLIEIEGVEVIIYKKEGKEFDQIRCDKARLNDNQGTLYSDGNVDITMGVPADEQPHGRLLQIHSSGVTYELKSGKAHTDRAANFEFQSGDGKSVGASYDPNSREIYMRSQVELHWRGRTPGAKPMKVEAGELIYKEKESYVLLRPWSRLTRETGVLEGGEAVVTLKEGAIQKVEAVKARGNNHQPGKDLQYSADHFLMTMNDDGEVDRIIGEPNARLVSVTDSARTTITARRVDMNFDTSSGSSELTQALTEGNTVLESAPVPRKDVLPAETRIVHSDRVQLKMRKGGRDLESVQTLTRGRLEFLPNRPGQRHRTLDCDTMFVTYGEDNIIHSFRATNAATRTDPEPDKDAPPAAKQPPGDPTLTWSKDLLAEFDPKTGQLARMDQWNDFRYQEGDRRARANKATLEQASNLITLDRNARIWDPSGATSADRILLDQKSGDITAEGNVISTRMPDQKGKSSSMLSNDQPLQAKAQKMKTTERNQKIRYEGRAEAWQAANRVWADTIDIDRDARRLVADKHVHTQFVDSKKSGDEDAKTDGAPKTDGAQKGSEKPPVFVNITAGNLVYTEADRLAHYTGGVHLVRPGMDVKGAQLRAFLNDADSDSSLDHAFADGAVEIVRAEPQRTVTGNGEHAEYYAKEQKIFLTGGKPVLVDSVRGVTHGQELTYYANNDKLLVNGGEKDPVNTRVIRRH